MFSGASERWNLPDRRALLPPAMRQKQTARARAKQARAARGGKARRPDQNSTRTRIVPGTARSLSITLAEAPASVSITT